MTAVITLLSSLFIALFLIGPAITARFLIELLIIKQPSRTQSSTEELARSLFGSLPFVAVAVLLVWMRYHFSHPYDPAVVFRLFSDMPEATRMRTVRELWPVLPILYCTYAEVLLYVLLVRYAVKRIPLLDETAALWSRYRCFTVLTSPYLKSEWDVLAGKILLPPGTEIYADVATKSQKIYMGRFENAKTASDGSLLHLQLSNPTIRGEEHAGPNGAMTRSEPYVFRNSRYFIIPASEIANVNLRSFKPVRTPGNAKLVSNPPSAAEEVSQPMLEASLEAALQGLNEETRRALLAGLDREDPKADL